MRLACLFFVGCASNTNPVADGGTDGNANPMDGSSMDAPIDSNADAFNGIRCRMLQPIGLGGGSCTFTWDQCTDGRVYQVNCPDSMTPCDCRIQDEGGYTSGNQIAQNVCNLPSSQWVQAINQGCGWNIGPK